MISEKVKSKLSNITNLPLSLAMRYSSPSIHQGIIDLLRQNSDIDRIIAVPLYPHYAMATTQTVVEKTNQVINTHFPTINVDYLPPFYNNDLYVNALSELITDHLSSDIDYLLFSYHGVPVRHLKKTDPTKKHCFKIKDCCFIPNPDAHPVCYAHQVKNNNLGNETN